ncbi:hypothetical protein SHJG_p1168 (plasmid) [Streptomyces hygroscopicus subsp. jinggangensis 5008]|nr:hypothetical protein SHJG_p1168 [Streptomyces hygroscopicus subsp. jinggangensis 5008]AGF68453.1 hypothetical protein SHJGH_p1168 [Streptomyces hygroscopicus subsp. jinggangensis TL01]
MPLECERAQRWLVRTDLTEDPRRHL